MPIRQILVGTVATLVGCAVAAPVAYALGVATYPCSVSGSVVGSSSATVASTQQTSANLCGSVKVRVGYYAPGGVSAYSNWAYASYRVEQTSSQYGSIFTGGHGVTSPGWAYPSAGEFWT